MEITEDLDDITAQIDSENLETTPQIEEEVIVEENLPEETEIVSD
jgi:hypothetical protein